MTAPLSCGLDQSLICDEFGMAGPPVSGGYARAARAWLVTSAQVLQLIGELFCASEMLNIDNLLLFQAPAASLPGLALPQLDS